jgi:hypothetical protein
VKREEASKLEREEFLVSSRTLKGYQVLLEWAKVSLLQLSGQLR